MQNKLPTVAIKILISVSDYPMVHWTKHRTVYEHAV